MKLKTEIEENKTWKHICDIRNVQMCLKGKMPTFILVIRLHMMCNLHLGCIQKSCDLQTTMSVLSCSRRSSKLLSSNTTATPAVKDTIILMRFLQICGFLRFNPLLRQQQTQVSHHFHQLSLLWHFSFPICDKTLQHCLLHQRTNLLIISFSARVCPNWINPVSRCSIHLTPRHRPPPSSFIAFLLSATDCKICWQPWQAR